MIIPILNYMYKCEKLFPSGSVVPVPQNYIRTRDIIRCKIILDLIFIISS